MAMRRGAATKPARSMEMSMFYGSGKRRCEALLRAWVEAGDDRRAVAFRPGAVYLVATVVCGSAT